MMALMAVVLSSSMSATAGEGHDCSKHSKGENVLFKELNLTALQKEQLKELKMEKIKEHKDNNLNELVKRLKLTEEQKQTLEKMKTEKGEHKRMDRKEPRKERGLDKQEMEINKLSERLDLDESQIEELRKFSDEKREDRISKNHSKFKGDKNHKRDMRKIEEGLNLNEEQNVELGKFKEEMKAKNNAHKEDRQLRMLEALNSIELTEEQKLVLKKHTENK